MLRQMAWMRQKEQRINEERQKLRDEKKQHESYDQLEMNQRKWSSLDEGPMFMVMFGIFIVPFIIVTIYMIVRR